MLRSFNALLVRDLKLAARVGGSGVMGLIFFLMIVTLIPFALGPDLNLLSRIGPAILWIAALLATLIGLDQEKLGYAKPDALVMHPGPMNRGVEISSDVADGAQSLIREQVEMGVAVRMAVLEALASHLPNR